MATRSRIAIEREEGTVYSIYCHFDGYPEHNGAVLQKHYQDRSKVEKLIALGDISILDREIEPKGEHSFENPETGVVVAYHRDRGDELRKAKLHKDKASYFKSDVEEYGYLFTKEGEWKYVEGDGSRQPQSCAKNSNKSFTV